MNVERITTLQELQRLTADWPCLTRGNPFRSWQWLGAWWKNYGEARDLYLLEVRDNGGTLLGIAPWYVEQSPSGGRTIKFLGSGKACTEYLSILATEEHERRVVRAIADWLMRANEPASDEPNRWDLLHLEAVETSDRLINRLVQQLVERGCKLHHKPSLNCWRIDLPDSWDDYVSNLSRSHRKQLRRLDERMFETGRAVLHTAASTAELEAGFEILVRLHQKRRNSLGEPGCFADPRFRPFLEEAACELLRLDCSELHWLEIDGAPAAADYHLTGNNTSFAYQTGVDPQAMDLEPGHLIHLATIKRAVALQRTAFDFLRGDEPYKAHWRARPVPLVELRVIPQTTSAQLRHGVWVAGDTLKHWIKTGISFAAAAR
jgi:CelD/BcsL family acetyltransferase involved in cellulose biosynthesis